MQWRVLHERDGQRTFVLVFDTGDEIIEGLRGFAREQGLSASSFTAIGAFREATLAFFDWDRKEYRDIPVPEQVEVASLAGDIARHDGQPRVHAHAVLGRSTGETIAGHLRNGRVRPTLEVMLTEWPGTLERVADPASGLPLIRP